MKKTEIKPIRLPGLKPGVHLGLILSGTMYPDLKIEVSRRERMKKTAILALLLALPLALAAKEKSNALPKPEPGQKIIQAARTETPIVIDGKLDEAIWKRPGSNGFTQTDPNDGQPATEKTDVWIAYDDKAIYVAAYCFDSDPKKIIGRLGRRDDRMDSDWFMFAVDPYYDKRTGYQFCVNPAGSIMDLALSNDVNDDESWDGVWDWKATVNGDGWIVEMKIPFNQIRFPKQDEYVWGVNFRRVVQRKNETASFAWVSKTEQAYVSKFARLEGLRGFSAGTHIEFMPYTIGQAQFRPEEQGNPFETGRKWLANAGFDLKIGLKSNLTLDASVNPDFGQVEVDPAVLNLSAYESFYEEKRPFFIEGASIFNGFGRGGIYINANINWPNPNFFYSRRIGRSPQGYVTQDGFVDFPDRSTILGAAKITGKLGGWNVGFINSLTARENATIDSFGLRVKEEVEPSTYYGVFRAQKDLDKGRHGFGILATGVMRNLDNPTLAGILNKNAFSLAVDGWSFLDEKRNWVVGGWVGGTRIEGTPEDIFRLQKSSLHYFQRPDASHVKVDPLATALTGWGGHFTLGKQTPPVLLLFSAGVLSPGFNPNDAGYQGGGSDIVHFELIPGYMWTKPGKVFQQAIVAAGVFQNYDFGGNKVSEGVIAISEGMFRNFWGYNFSLFVAPATLNNRLTRGGPMAMGPGGWQTEFKLETDGRRPIVLEGGGTLSRSPGDGNGWSGRLAVRWKPSPNMSLSIGPQYAFETTETQWVGRFADALMTTTFGQRYVFSHLEQQVVSAEIRVNWSFTPKLSLQAYLQPFIGVGAYNRFKELARTREYAYNAYGDGPSTVVFADDSYTIDPDGDGPAAAFSFGNPDFNVKSLRGTVVLRWEYMPGSLFYLVWTQNRADYANAGRLQLRRDMGDLLTAPGDNIFMFKISYRWGL